MKKTLIALMALAGVAAAETYDMTKGGDLYADPITLNFDIIEDLTVSGDYDIIAAYYQRTDNKGYNVNALMLGNDGALTLARGHSLSLTEGKVTSESTLTVQDKSIFMSADNAEAAFVLTTPGSYTLEYLGGGNGSAAADLYLNGVKVASFTAGSHNMNGVENGSNTITLNTNDAYEAIATNYKGMPAPEPSIPEPTTATLSLLALAGLAARRRRH